MSTTKQSEGFVDLKATMYDKTRKVNSQVSRLLKVTRFAA